MDNLTLIKNIDEALGQSVKGSRKVHIQIRNVTDHFKKGLEAEREKEGEKKEEV